MPVPAILPLLALGVGFIALLANSKAAAASPPSGAGDRVMSNADLLRLAQWSKANLTPEQDQMITLMLRASQQSKGRIEIGDVCSALGAQLTAPQMADVVSQFPVLAECNAPAPGTPSSEPPAPGDMPSLPDATPGQPAPPPPDSSAPGGGGSPGGGAALPTDQGSISPNVQQSPAGIAATQLYGYLNATGDFGSKAKPSASVKKYQAAMGGGLKADGIVGPKTIARAKALGVKLPTAPKAAPSGKPNAQKVAATELRTYLESTKDFGSKTKPSATVKYYQKLMAGGLAQDGVVGPKTIARAKALGVELPAPTGMPASTSAAPSSTSSQTSAASKAAAGLRDYLIATGDFGSKAHPSAKVKGYQGPLGVTADGIVGPKTRDAAAKYGSILPMPGSSSASPTASAADLMKRPPSIILATRAASAPSSGGAISGASGDLVPALSESSFSPLISQIKGWASAYLTPTLEAQLYAKVQQQAKAKGANLNKLPLDYEAVSAIFPAGQACALLSSTIGGPAWAALKKIPTMTARMALACENRLQMPDGFPKATWNAASAAQQKQIVLNFVPGVAVVTPQKPTVNASPTPGANASSSAQQAAQKLAAYLSTSQDFGSKAKPSATVKTYQAQMGGLTADGIVGPKTNARASALGVSLPAPRTNAVPAQAAAQLGQYLATSRDFGSKAKPSAQVKSYQGAMGGITADGIVGPNTRLRAAQLGTTLPAAPASAAPAPAPKPAAAAPAGYNAAEAKRLSRLVVQDIQQHGATYNRGMLKNFQKAAGLTADGLYGGRSVGALKYFGSTRAPAALFNPKAEVPYAPPA